MNFVIHEEGKILSSCTINEIGFHAIKVELPIHSIEKVLNSDYSKIFTCDGIRSFRPPVGQCKVFIPSESMEGDFKSGNTTGEPIVAVLDGVPFVQHNLLKNRINLDDPDGFIDENNYPANARKHGTAMASLICHGELDAHEEPLNRPIYFRPIMKPDTEDFISNPPLENIPKDYFMEDLILRSVRRIFEGGPNEAAAAPSIKIINISIADKSKMFFNNLSSCGKLLDWLSNKYKVLFCVSAGNIDADIDLQKSLNEIKSLPNDTILRLTMEKIDFDKRNRKILSPADSINSITVGSIHADKSNATNIGNRIDILPNQDLPSPISAHGLGYKNSIKPELYISGGRQLFDEINKIYKISNSGLAPGQCVATSPTSGGELNRCFYIRGTSNSAALATRTASQIYEMLSPLILENNISIDESNVAVILKALLVHSASWGEGYSILKKIFSTNQNKKQFKRNFARYMGFGIPNIQRVLECASQRATAIGFGKIKKDEKNDFQFPLPPCLSGINEIKRLIITLAWFSPINPANRKYRKANLSIEPPMDDIGVERINADWQQVKNGTVQHEVFEGSKVVSYHDGKFMKISVVCREDAKTLDEDVYYGLAVTLEAVEKVNSLFNIDLPIYEEIRARIGIPIKVEEKIS